MKKLFLSLVVAIVAATATFAQNTLIATLSHGEEISMYYGSYALRDALNASVSGDVINLSGGAFQAVNITKAITLRGTGIDVTNPTYIIGNFDVNIPSDDTNRLTMEGIRCTGVIYMKGTLNNPYFVKCAFYSFNSNNNSSVVKNAMFANCRISWSFLLNYGSGTVQFINSFVKGFENSGTTAASFINCVVVPSDFGYYPEYIRSSQLINCIIFQTKINNNLTDKFPSSTIATNCVSIGYTGLFDNQAASTGNKSYNRNDFALVFKDFTGTYSEAQQYELADEARTTLIGTDGTEVGLYGGILPYSSTPSYPQITKMNVAKKTTADGKLSVEIEVSAVE